jgi:hypothetical protein
VKVPMTLDVGGARARAVSAGPDQRRVTMAVSPSHQTIRLSAGRHRGPEHGACVMELVSMLAGGPFSDHPPSVSAVIAAFLRSYNDHVDDERRQDLYRYAARVSDTRAGADVERRRSQICLAWAHACCHRPELRVRILHLLLRYCQGPDVHGAYAARAAVLTPGAHPRALALLDELIDIGRDHASLEPFARSRHPPLGTASRASPMRVYITTRRATSGARTRPPAAGPLPPRDALKCGGVEVRTWASPLRLRLHAEPPYSAKLYAAAACTWRAPRLRDRPSPPPSLDWALK